MRRTTVIGLVVISLGGALVAGGEAAGPAAHAQIATPRPLGTVAVQRPAGPAVKESIPQAPTGTKVAKLESRLAQVAAAYARGGSVAAVDAARERRLHVQGGKIRVVVEAQAASAAARAAAASDVRAAGGEVEAQEANLVQALVSPGRLVALAHAASVVFVRPPFDAVPDTVAGQETAASGADAFIGYGWNGAGAKVAVIDLGFAGYATRQSEGELPALVTTVDDCGGALTTATSHGTAVAEIVHEMAPAAELTLICVDSEVTLGQAEAYVKANGIKIVNHSVAWLNTWRGDGGGPPGTPDAVVADARANGILWVNAAGNFGFGHWSGTFTDPDGNGFQNFAGTDEGNTIFLPSGVGTCAFLKWDNWPTTTNDYDLLLYRSSDGALMAESINDQTTGGSPTEALCFTNTGGSQSYFLAIGRYSAASFPRFDLFLTAGALQYQTVGSVTEPASSPNAMAVGALCWQTGGLEPYSSTGPTIDSRIKPDIAGLDAVSSATYGASSGCNSGFTGTSAASPEVAGAAALFLGQTPTLTGPQLQKVLEARALDIGPAGRDTLVGSGVSYVYTFTDVPPWLGLSSYVEQLFHKGVTSGCALLNLTTGARPFCPENSVTRRDMAVFIVRANGLAPLFPSTPTFSDVPASLFGFGEVERMYADGITTGCYYNSDTGERRYCPLDPVTRRDMAVFMVRAKGLAPLLPDTPTFSDVPATMFGFGHVERMYEQGITTGCYYNANTGERRYCPLDLVSRRAMAAFLIRAFGP